ncbi:NBR1-Ig-like domain-containing protein [Spirillospora sp. NPDC047279]|uniref:NBR1-Ig-like domain-containing protein n=1 Tax=Spirillospora sp. NPDC047279 TaxID=3155478 RepID=UPI0033C940B8
MDQGHDGGRRGRKSRRPDPATGPAAALAERLWRLKQEAGDPSYAEMAALGAAASKSSLAAAAQGRNLPTWGTTWEFVRVLAVDRLGRDAEEVEREWRVHWQQARDAVTAAEDAEEFGRSGAAEEPSSGRSPTRTTAEMIVSSQDLDYPHQVHDLTGAPARILHLGTGFPPPAQRFPLGVLAIAAAVALIAVSGIAYLAWPSEGAAANPQESGKPKQMSPVTTPLDDSQFIGDITYPDGTRVKAGTTFEKVWRLRNSGTVHWKDRRMLRLGAGRCPAPRSVPIPSTPPGHLVDVRVRVRAAESPGRCKIYWKMADATGRVLMPAKRPIFLDVQVVGP